MMKFSFFVFCLVLCSCDVPCEVGAQQPTCAEIETAVLVADECAPQEGIALKWAEAKQQICVHSIGCTDLLLSLEYVSDVCGDTAVSMLDLVCID